MRSVALALLALSCAASSARPAGEPPPAATPRRAGEARVPGGSAYGREPEVSLTPLERSAADAVTGRAGRPALSPALVLAARELARRAADGEREPLAPRRVRAALGRAAAFDPAPWAYVVSGGRAGVAELLAERIEPGATHVGVGAESRGERTWLVALAARRAATLAPFPREVAVGDEVPLRGSLAGLRDPRVVLTLPSGGTREVSSGSGSDVDATIAFDAPGRHVVEVLGTGPRGPEVAALLAVWAGGSADEEPAPAEARGGADPDDLAAAEARVEAALNALRARHGLAPVAPSAALKQIARRHSADMLAQGVMAHVLPGTGDVRARLRRGGVAYRRAMENVAKGASALEAHEVAEESPAHRANMLDPAVRLVGVGAARTTLRGGETLVYLTEILVEPQPARSGAGAEAEVRVALARERARREASPLAPDAELDALARAEAETMARDESLGGQRLANRALELGGRRLSAADAFLSGAPEDAARSRHAGDPRFRRVGVGVAASGGGRQPPGLLWIAIVYTD